MNMPTTPFLPLAAALTLLLTPPAAAQQVQDVSFTAGTHVWGAPYWTDDVWDPQARFGLGASTDQLNHVFWLEVHTPSLALQPGTYIAQAHIAKTVSAGGAADLIVNVTSGTQVLGSATWTTAMQTVGSYVWTPQVLFTVIQPTTVELSVWNTNNQVQKTNYRFDRVHYGQVPIGLVADHFCLDSWSYFPAPNFSAVFPHPTSAYGRARTQLTASNNMGLQRLITLPAGTWAINARLKNNIGYGGSQNAGAQDMWFGTNSPNQWVVMLGAQQPVGQFFYMPDFVVTLAAPTSFMLQFNGTPGHLCAGYVFDSVAVRSLAPQFLPFGQGCGNLTLTSSAPASIGGSVALAISGGSASAGLGIFGFGAAIPPLALDPFGMPGCLLHVQTYALLFGLPVGPGAFTLSFAIPASPSLVGAALDVQGAVADAAANTGGLLAANAGRVVIGQ